MSWSVQKTTSKHDKLAGNARALSISLRLRVARVLSCSTHPTLEVDCFEKNIPEKSMKVVILVVPSDLPGESTFEWGKFDLHTSIHMSQRQNIEH